MWKRSDKISNVLLQNNEWSNISILIRYFNHLKIIEQPVIRIKLWGFFVLFCLGGKQKMMNLYSHLNNHKTLSLFLLPALFLPFLFLLACGCTPFKWVRQHGKVNLSKGIWINAAGETKGTSVYCLESKTNKSISRTQTVVSQRQKNPCWFRGLSNHWMPACLNTYGLKSLGFCVS